MPNLISSLQLWRRMRRLENLAARIPDPSKEPENSDEMIAWLAALPADQRRKLEGEATERVINWELATFGELDLPLLKKYFEEGT